MRNKGSSSSGQRPVFNGDQTKPEEALRAANVVIVKNLNHAARKIQIQALELLRTTRIFTHTAVYSMPKPFLFIALTSTGSQPLVNHLNDHIFMSHYHDSQDGFANLEEGSEWVEDDRASLSSVVHKSAVKGSTRDPLVSSKVRFYLAFYSSSLMIVQDIETLMDLRDAAVISPEIVRYLQNVVTFLRIHRAVDGGISPAATKHFKLLVKSLAPLHSLDFVTPSLVALAARKIYRHRIHITAPEDERSMQYGSNLAAVAALLEGVTAEGIIEEVLASVEAPL
ncbi:hypothetical protein MMC09_003244 [Bachmanniomyces sp. S44760]|nr:hypothetical protein [Bachmanniomyces sp. S44760]